MDSSTRAMIAVGVAAGYIVGRNNKEKLALSLLSLATGRALDPMALLGQGIRKLTESPQFEQFSESLTSALEQQTRSLLESEAAGKPEDVEDVEDEEDVEGATDEGDEEEGAGGEEEPGHPDDQAVTPAPPSPPPPPSRRRPHRLPPGQPDRRTLPPRRRRHWGGRRRPRGPPEGPDRRTRRPRRPWPGRPPPKGQRGRKPPPVEAGAGEYGGSADPCPSPVLRPVAAACDSDRPETAHAQVSAGPAGRPARGYPADPPRDTGAAGATNHTGPEQPMRTNGLTRQWKAEHRG